MSLDNAILEKTIPLRSGQMAWRRIGDEVVLVPVGASSGELDDGVYLLDEVAAFIWQLIDGRRQFSDIVDEVVAEFEVERERAAADLEALLTRLAGIGALESEAG